MPNTTSPFKPLDLAMEGMRWNEYDRALRTKNRHVPNDVEYFTELFQGCLKCESELPAGSSLYRARIMPPEKETDTEPLPISEMGQPPPELTPDGRVNPAGIPCFYAALEGETAIAELRPWPRARLTVATFDTAGPLKVLDLRNSNPRVNAVRSVYWAAFMISRPVHRDDRFGYLGTQYLAERLKAAGANGILYVSTLEPGGTNVALFSDSGLKPMGVSFHEVTAVPYRTARLTPRPSIAKTLSKMRDQRK